MSADIIPFDDPDADLVRPKWFYKRVEELTQQTCDHFAWAMESCPSGPICFDDVWFAMAETPVRLMALMEGDDDLEEYVCVSAMYRAAFKAISGQRGSVN